MQPDPNELRSKAEGAERDLREAEDELKRLEKEWAEACGQVVCD